MTNQIARTFAAVSFLFGLAVTAAHAQSAPVKATIPFSFTVGGQTLPAGEYQVRQQANSPHLIAVTSADRKISAITIRQAAYAKSTSGRSVLIFRRYGNQHFLARVFAEGLTVGSELPMSKAERRLIKRLPDRHLAREQAAPEYVTVIAAME
jgi:hypothetical protein